MTLFTSITFKAPVLRVCDREQNIHFYQDILGFKLLNEENSLTFFGSLNTRTPLFVLEESPEYRTRTAKPCKKLQSLSLTCKEPSDILHILQKSPDIHKLFKGQKGYGLEIFSPEGDKILLHCEDDPTHLQEIREIDNFLDINDNWQGLQDYRISQLTLNVSNKKDSEIFYAPLPLSVDFIQRFSEDLNCLPNETWDLEILEFSVPKDYNLNALASYYQDQGYDVFLDKKESILVLSDPSKIEVWFCK